MKRETEITAEKTVTDVRAACAYYAAAKDGKKGARRLVTAAAVVATDGDITRIQQAIRAGYADISTPLHAEVEAATREERATREDAQARAQDARAREQQAARERAPEAVAKLDFIATVARARGWNAIREAVGLPAAAKIRMPVPVEDAQAAVTAMCAPEGAQEKA